MAGRWSTGFLGWTLSKSCGENYTTTGAHNLSLAQCDVQAGDLLLIGLAHVKTGGVVAGVIVVNNAGATSLYEKNAGVGSNRTACHRLYSLVAGAGTKAAGISYTINSDVSVSEGRIEAFVLRGWTLNTFVTSGALGNPVSVGPLTGANFIVGLNAQGSAGGAGVAIAGQQRIAGPAHHGLFSSDGSTVSVSVGSGTASAAMVRLL